MTTMLPFSLQPLLKMKTSVSIGEKVPVSNSEQAPAGPDVTAVTMPPMNQSVSIDFLSLADFFMKEKTAHDPVQWSFNRLIVH